MLVFNFDTTFIHSRFYCLQRLVTQTGFFLASRRTWIAFQGLDFLGNWIFPKPIFPPCLFGDTDLSHTGWLPSQNLTSLKTFSSGRANWGHNTLGHRELGPLGTWATENLGYCELGPLGPLGTWYTGNLGHWELGPLGTWATVNTGYSCDLAVARRRRGWFFSPIGSGPGGSGLWNGDRDKHWVQFEFLRTVFSKLWQFPLIVW